MSQNVFQALFPNKAFIRMILVFLVMQFLDLTKRDLELVEKARDLIEKRKSERSSVASALRTRSGSIFEGVNIEIQCSAPCSICAEYAAIGTMFSEGEDEIETIVAYSFKESGHVLPPCGKCRQFIAEFGDPYVIVQIDKKLKKAKLSELYPLPVASK